MCTGFSVCVLSFTCGIHPTFTPGRYRSLQAPHLHQPVAARPPLPPPASSVQTQGPPPPPPLLRNQQQQQAVYNLGQYFPRGASEPPQRKHYQTLRGGEVGTGCL